MSKTIWLVDAAYLLKAAPGSFDYLKLKNELETKNGEKFFESYYLNSTPNPPTDAQDSFHTWLKMAPPKGPKMRVKLYKLKSLHNTCPSCSHQFDRQVQKGVDVGLATMVVKLAAQNQYERVIISAGDGDYEDSIAFAKQELHKEIWLSGFQGSMSADLQSYADNVIWLEDIWDQIKKDNPANN
jgi:uncharacterized LabA/DUF88 family protein